MLHTLNICVCVYIYIHTYIYTHIFSYIHLFIHSFILWELQLKGQGQTGWVDCCSVCPSSTELIIDHIKCPYLGNKLSLSVVNIFREFGWRDDPFSLLPPEYCILSSLCFCFENLQRWNIGRLIIYHVCQHSACSSRGIWSKVSLAYIWNNVAFLADKFIQRKA